MKKTSIFLALSLFCLSCANSPAREERRDMKQQDMSQPNKCDGGCCSKCPNGNGYNK